MSRRGRDGTVRCLIGGPVIGSLVVDSAAFRSRLAAGARVTGTVVTLPDVALAELTASVVDFVWIDLEHGALGARDVLPLAVAARAAGAAGLVRVSGVDDPALGPALDAGVQGVIVPRVESAAEAQRAVRRLRYPPRGSRGVAARRASSYGLGPRRAADPVCMVQIESGAGVDEAEAIAEVDGVDALVVGCGDLALDLGEDTARRSARLHEAIAHVQRACTAAGIASGVAGPDDPELLIELARGRSTVLVLGADVRIYARALGAAAGRLQNETAHDAPEPEEAHVRT
jgi:4-hydroxy-2-oxoheptanedioate aldolase